MARISLNESFTVGAGKSSVDSNRLYSILLDARASAVSETTFDIAEKIVVNEKDNAKSALERLWALKKNLQGQDTGTVDLIIQYYQNKLDVLRSKEERIKKIGKDSRSLLEDKRQKDMEIATVKQELEDVNLELQRLNDKLHKATVKEQELALIDTQLKKELDFNENEVVNGLYEIIFSPHDADAQPEDGSEASEGSGQPVGEAAADDDTADHPGAAEEPEEQIEKTVSEAVPLAEDPLSVAGHPDILEAVAEVGGADTTPEDFHALYQQVESPEVETYPKSVVKTTGGTVIGEYFYDPKVYKNKRNYVYHSLFLGEQLTRKVDQLVREFSAEAFSEAQQVVLDSQKRICGNAHLHFEISTNEIVNEKTLKNLAEDLKERRYDDVRRFCNRLRAKIANLGKNYRTMLKEQMERYSAT